MSRRLRWVRLCNAFWGWMKGWRGWELVLPNPRGVALLLARSSSESCVLYSRIAMNDLVGAVRAAGREGRRSRIIGNTDRTAERIGSRTWSRFVGLPDCHRIIHELERSA